MRSQFQQIWLDSYIALLGFLSNREQQILRHSPQNFLIPRPVKCLVFKISTIHAEGYAGVNGSIRENKVDKQACVMHLCRNVVECFMHNCSTIAKNDIKLVSIIFASEGGSIRYPLNCMPKVAAIAHNLMGTGKMNKVGPEAGLTWVIERVPGHKIYRLEELMRGFGSTKPVQL
jgi:hypothetical protein